MSIAHKIVGNAMQMAVCQPAEGQTVYGEAGKFRCGEGLSLATREGDGTVILQSMTIEGLSKALAKNTGIGDEKKGPLGGLLSGSLE